MAGWSMEASQLVLQALAGGGAAPVKSLLLSIAGRRCIIKIKSIE